MFLDIADANGSWVVFYEDKSLNPRRVICMALREYQSGGKRKIVPIVHGGGGKLVDANSVGKISAMLAGKSAQNKMLAGQTPDGDTMPDKPVEPALPSQPDPVPELEDEDDDE